MAEITRAQVEAIEIAALLRKITANILNILQQMFGIMYMRFVFIFRTKFCSDQSHVSTDFYHLKFLFHVVLSAPVIEAIVVENT